MVKPASYRTAEPTWIHGYLWGPVESILEGRGAGDKRVLEIGCGKGSFANRLSELGYKVTGIDPSESGVAVAQDSFPHLNLTVGSAYDDLPGDSGSFRMWSVSK